MVILIQHVFNDSFASFLRYSKQRVWCAYWPKPLITPSTWTVAVGSSELSASPGLALACRKLFTQGLLTSNDWGVWLMQKYKGLALSAPTEATWKVSRVSCTLLSLHCGPISPPAIECCFLSLPPGVGL